MTITVPLEPQTEAKLIALAKERGVTTGELVRSAIDAALAEVPDSTAHKAPSISLRGLLAKYGPAPSAEEIDENRAEMYAGFPRTDF